MPVTAVHKDLDAPTMTVVADFAVPPGRAWDAYLDPRQIERFWGPPHWPATFTRHDMFPGGRSAYTMTGPDGDVSAGFWECIAVDAPHRFEVRDGFALPDGSPNTELPTMRMVGEFAATETGTRFTCTSWFGSRAEFEQLLEMGMEEGMREAMGQIDAVLADDQTFGADAPVLAQELGERGLRISRVIHADVQTVWDAHHDPAAVAGWMTGPDGWSMPTCRVATEVGERYRYEWRDDATGATFGIEGEVLESLPPRREVTRERPADGRGEGDVNELTLTPVTGGTLLCVVITAADAAAREAALASGMIDGMETGYRRLDDLVRG